MPTMVSIGFFDNSPAFATTNDVFDLDSFAAKPFVLLLLVFGQFALFRLFNGNFTIAMNFLNSLIAQVGLYFNFTGDAQGDFPKNT